MRKKILFGVFSTVFLMLMIPLNSAFESESVKNNLSTDRKDTREEKVVTIIKSLISKIKNSKPEAYNEINEKLNKYNLENPPGCRILLLLFLVCCLFETLPYPLVYIIVIPFYAIFLTAHYIGCDWANEPIPDP